MRSGMMKAHGVLFLPSANSIFGIRLLDSTHLNVRSSTAVELLLQRLEHQPHRIARRPARQARHHVLGQHRLAIMELEARAQLEGPGRAIVETSSASTICRCGWSLSSTP